MNLPMTIAVLGPIMILVGYFDLRYMRIPNALSWILLALFVLTSLSMEVSEIMLQLFAATIVFAVCFTAFCFRILGGGDVKILSALILFIPFQELVIFANVLSFSLLLGVVFIVTMRRIIVIPNQNWKYLSGSTGFPMGISIAAAGIIHPYAALMLTGV